MAKFTHLHVHSHYSLLDGLSKIDDLINRAKDLGMEALALTDHGALYGAVEFYKKAVKAGIKPILGVEAYIAPRDRFSREAGERYFHLILLAENNTGWKNLLKLVTKAHLEGFYYKPRIDKEILKEYHEGLIGLSGCYSGELIRAIMENRPAEPIIQEYKEIFGPEHFFIEIGYHPNFDPKNHAKVWPALLELSRKTNTPLVATQDIHYTRPEDAEYHDILLAVQTGSKLTDEDRMTLKLDDFSMTSPEQMAEKFKGIPEAIENTALIAKRCNLALELHQIHLPDFPKPEGITADTYLRKLIEERISHRFPGAIAPEIKKRLEYELDVIEKTGFADYFLIVQDLTNWAKSHGIAVGPGRGSAAGSLVSYILGITEINPLDYDLLFERFLNPERNEMPDIDIDFADTRRDEVLGYAREKYGADHVAQIITFGTMAARAAVRDAGRAMGFSYGFCDRIAKLIPFNLNLENALKVVPELQELRETNADAKRLLDTAMHLEGVARHASVHACGTVISKEPLVDYVPLQFAPQDKNTIITQFEMHSIEDLGLMKIDLLGLKNLTIIENTVRLVKELGGEEVKIAELPLDDKKTFELLRAGNTTGVFQFECLSGDTMISNTTIKKLYENGGKKSLRSVYVDEGKIRNNRILQVVKSGIKEVYALIVENGRHIKATKDHYFLTEGGWKKLGDMLPGDRVLMKTNAKHSLYNTCDTCGKQIDGQREGKSHFCYACSARFYSNPSKGESRRKISEAKIKFHRAGGTVWNLGLTTETNKLVAETGLKIAQALQGRSLEEKVGPERARVTREKLSKRFRGPGNPMFGRPSPHRKGGVRNDLGHYVRSNWEADFARILNLHSVAYEYEPETFALIRENGEVVHYTPDFYVPSTNTFYEIKGWLHDADKEKIDLFERQYPHYNFVLINTTKFAELALRYKNLIAWECPHIPLERGFQFVSIREIRLSGPEETYDIAMEAPGNNFIANGFVVHNSSGMRRYMKEIKPTQLEDLIALVALFRPGPMELIPSFIRRKNDEEKITYLHPRLEPILQNTYGIGVYQEQMMRIARDLAGYTLPEADTLRKAIGKKIKSLLDEQKEKLVSGMVRGGIDKKTAEAIWELFPPFARYGFNKSHAACYALIGYRTAYLKAHYPVEFMASLLNADSNDVDRIAFLVNEARQSDIEILPPDINKSFVHFAPEEKGIRFGLLAIKNVGEQIATNIIEERLRGGPFRDFGDFLSRIQHKDLNKKSLESLVKSGVFDSLGVERNQVFQNMEEVLRFNAIFKKTGPLQTHGSLFGEETPRAKLVLKPIPAANPQEKLSWEKELLGFYLSDHPLNAYKDTFQGAHVKPIAEALQIKNDRLTFRIGGIITKIQKILTKAGQPMLFARIEDFSSQPMEVVVFNNTLMKTMAVWEENNVVLIEGRISLRNGEVKMICESAKKLTD